MVGYEAYRPKLFLVQLQGLGGGAVKYHTDLLVFEIKRGDGLFDSVPQ